MNIGPLRSLNHYYQTQVLDYQKSSRFQCEKLVEELNIANEAALTNLLKQEHIRFVPLLWKKSQAIVRLPDFVIWSIKFTKYLISYNASNAYSMTILYVLLNTYIPVKFLESNTVQIPILYWKEGKSGLMNYFRQTRYVLLRYFTVVLLFQTWGFRISHLDIINISKKHAKLPWLSVKRYLLNKWNFITGQQRWLCM